MKVAERKSNLLEQLQKDREEIEEFNRLERRRRAGSFTQVIYTQDKKKNLRPVERYRSQAPYTFLQYIRIINKWAEEFSGLDISRIELILYLYPIGVFNREEFLLMKKVIDINKRNILKELIDSGWIKIWRKRNSRQKQRALYALAPKATDLCSRMHRMCLGDEPIPESSRNSLTTNKEAKNKYYMDVIKKMNRRGEG